MKNLFFMWWVFVIFSSCGNTSSQMDGIVKYYPDKSYFKNYNLVQINLDSINLKFDELSELVDEIHRKDSLPFFILKTDDYTRNIGILRNNTVYIKRSSILCVGKDSIFIDDGYRIQELMALMKRHYENNGENPHYPINAENAMIQIDLNPNSNIVDFEKTLELVSSTFDTLNLKHNGRLKLKLILAQDIPPPPH